MISWLVTGGVFGAGSGILSAAPAFAESGDPQGLGGGSSRQVGVLRQSVGTPPPGSNRVVRPPRARPGLSGDAGGDNPAVTAAPTRRPVSGPQLGMPVDRVPSLPVAALDSVALPGMAVAPVVAPVGPAFVHATVPSSPALARTPAPALPAPTGVRDQPAAATPRPSRVGIPASVTEAALPRIEPAVVPGLVALLGLTAVGIFLGYRQTRAGIVLNSTGTRYLR